MTETIPTSGRDVGRPRIYSDEAIFQGTDLVLRRDGVSELTLEAIAREVGCTRQALVRRFRSKQGLLLAFLDAMVGSVAAAFAEPGAGQGSPLHALRAQFTRVPVERVDMAGDPDAQAKFLVFLLTTSEDPEFAAHLGRLNRLNIQAIEVLLQAAVEQHELRPIDTALVARIFYDIWAGEIMHWCIDRSSDMTAELSAAFDLVIEPYRAKDAVHA